MDRDKIEAEDQRLIKKIRAIVYSKNKHSALKKPLLQKRRFWPPVFCAGLVLIGALAFREQFSLKVSNNSNAISKDIIKENSAPVLGKHTSLSAKIEDKDMAPGGKSLEKPIPITPKEVAHSPQKAVPRKTATKPPDDLSTPKRSSETSAPALLEPAKQKRISSRMQIAEIVSCKNVSNRQYDLPEKIFSFKEKSSPVVWMSVLSDNPPFTLTHVYYANGHRYCEVPLEVRYPRMRTWSKITLNTPDQIGNWRVEVMTDSGEKLGEIEFTVVP